MSLYSKSLLVTLALRAAGRSAQQKMSVRERGSRDSTLGSGGKKN